MEETNVVEYTMQDIENILAEIIEKRKARKTANDAAKAAKAEYDAVWNPHKAKMGSDPTYAEMVKAQKAGTKETKASLKAEVEALKAKLAEAGISTE